jgi:hypothetical protein
MGRGAATCQGDRTDHFPIAGLYFLGSNIPTPCLEGDLFNHTRLGAMKSHLINLISYFLHGVENTDVEICLMVNRAIQILAQRLQCKLASCAAP